MPDQPDQPRPPVPNSPYPPRPPVVDPDAGTITRPLDVLDPFEADIIEALLEPIDEAEPSAYWPLSNGAPACR